MWYIFSLAIKRQSVFSVLRFIPEPTAGGYEIRKVTFCGGSDVNQLMLTFRGFKQQVHNKVLVESNQSLLGIVVFLTAQIEFHKLLLYRSFFPVLRKILDLSWSELLHDVFASQIMDSETYRMCYVNGDKINACRVLVREPGRDRPLERQRRRCEDNIK